MKKAPTYEELLVENTILRDQNKRKDERIAYLERLLYGADVQDRRCVRSYACSDLAGWRFPPIIPRM